MEYNIREGILEQIKLLGKNKYIPIKHRVYFKKQTNKNNTSCYRKNNVKIVVCLHNTNTLISS